MSNIILQQEVKLPLECGCIRVEKMIFFEEKPHKKEFVKYELCEKHQPYLSGNEDQQLRMKMLKKVSDKRYQQSDKGKETMKKYQQTEAYKEYQRQYDSSEVRLEQKRKYYENNKEKIAESRNAKTDCPCGGRYALRHKAEHFKTGIHQYWVKSQDVEHK